MTDEQIIKALECCGNQMYLCNDRQCKSKTLGDAIDLINSQKAEIRELKKKNQILIKNADTAFQDGLDENRDLFKTEIEPKIRAEAIKEFTERIKRYIDVGHLRPPTEICFSELAVIEMIDNLVKRMTEVQE